MDRAARMNFHLIVHDDPVAALCRHSAEVERLIFAAVCGSWPETASTREIVRRFDGRQFCLPPPRAPVNHAAAAASAAAAAHVVEDIEDADDDEERSFPVFPLHHIPYPPTHRILLTLQEINLQQWRRDLPPNVGRLFLQLSLKVEREDEEAIGRVPTEISAAAMRQGGFSPRLLIGPQHQFYTFVVCMNTSGCRMLDFMQGANVDSQGNLQPGYHLVNFLGSPSVTVSDVAFKHFDPERKFLCV